MTKEQINALVKSLDKLGLGTDDGDGVHGPQSTQNEALLMLALSVPLY